MANSGQGGEGKRNLVEVVVVEEKEKKVEIIEDDEDEGLPDAATAKKLIKEFETVTNTDEIMAQYQLQVAFPIYFYRWILHLMSLHLSTCNLV